MLAACLYVFRPSTWHKAEEHLKIKLVTLAIINSLIQTLNVIILVLFMQWLFGFSLLCLIIYTTFILVLSREMVEVLRYYRIYIILHLISNAIAVIYYIYMIGQDVDKAELWRLYNFFSVVINIPILVMMIHFIELFIQNMPHDEDKS